MCGLDHSPHWSIFSVNINDVISVQSIMSLAVIIQTSGYPKRVIVHKSPENNTYVMFIHGKGVKMLMTICSYKAQGTSCHNHHFFIIPTHLLVSY